MLKSAKRSYHVHFDFSSDGILPLQVDFPIYLWKMMNIMDIWYVLHGDCM